MFTSVFTAQPAGFGLQREIFFEMRRRSHRRCTSSGAEELAEVSFVYNAW
jgi:hypothetical protein